jgi:MFS family permease
VWLVWIAGLATPLNIVVIAAINGFIGGMVGPAWNSFIPMLVPRELMAGAIRLNAMQFAFGRALGPVLATAVLHPFGPGATLFINVASYVFVIVVLMVLRPPTTAPVRGEPPWRQAVEGWRYVLARRSLIVVPLTMLVTGFFGSSLVQLASAISEEQFQHDASSIGLLVGAFGVGSVVGSLLVTAYGDRTRRSDVLIASFAFWIVGLAVLALSSTFLIGLLGLGLMGVAHVGTATTMATALNLQVDEEYRGRAAVAHMQGILLGVGFGALGLAQVANATSLETMELISAGALAGFLVLGAWMFASYRLIDTNTASPVEVRRPRVAQRA